MSSMILSTHDYGVLMTRYTSLKDCFEKQRSTFREIRDTSAPGLGRGLDGTSTEEDRDDLRRKFLQQLHIAGSRARLVLSSGLMSGMTPPARPWFRLGSNDLSLNDYKPVASYLYDTAKVMQAIFRAGGVYKMLPLIYGEIAAFGTGASFIAPDPVTVVRAKPLTIGEFYIAQNNHYEVDTIYRDIMLTAEQMIAAFGIDNVPRMVKEAYRKTNDTLFKVIHAVEPNDDRLELHKKVAFNRPFRSVYFMEGTSEGQYKALDVGGYDVFPAVVPRWMTVGNGVYGIGPGHLALGVNNLLLTEQRRWIKVMDRATGSPLVADERLRETVLNLRTDAVNFVSSGALNTSRAPVSPIFSEQMNYAPLREAIEDAVIQVKQAYHEDLFLMLNQLQREATATEILRRDQERILVLGPVLDNLNNELLDKLIQITYINMLSAGFAPAMPPELEGSEINIEYISTLAVSQKMAGLEGTNQMLGLIGNLSKQYPETKGKLKPFAVVNQFAEILGIDPNTLASDEEATEAYAQELQAQQQASASSQIAVAADAAQKLGTTKLGQGSVLDTMIERSRGAQ